MTATVERLAAQGHLIGGDWYPSAASGHHDHRYAATGRIQARVGLAGASDVGAAVDARGAAVSAVVMVPSSTYRSITAGISWTPCA